MSVVTSFSADVLRIDAEIVARELQDFLRETVFHRLKRKGVVLGISGGIDSSVVAALAARALGADRVLGLMMPEADSSGDSERLAAALAATFGIKTVREEITGTLDAAGCYRRRDDAIRAVVPEYGDGWKCKIVLPDQITQPGYAIFSIVVSSPAGEQQRVRLPLDAYLAIVAATNFKQRVRKMIEYHYADRLRYAVAGTPNRLEHDQGFFVKLGDGAADVKPIAHLYKSQVYQLADVLGVPGEIRRRTPTTDTYPLEQTQAEFYFGLSLEQTDLCMYALDHDVAAEEAAPAVGLTPEQTVRAFRVIESKREAARYLHAEAVTFDDVRLKVGGSVRL
jgi:NAD+ synthase